MSLNQNYRDAVMAYVNLFCHKNGLVFEGWLDCTGGHASISEMVIGFLDMKYDVDVSVLSGTFKKWYDHFEEHVAMGLNPISYIEYVKATKKGRLPFNDNMNYIDSEIPEEKDHSLD